MSKLKRHIRAKAKAKPKPKTKPSATPRERLTRTTPKEKPMTTRNAPPPSRRAPDDAERQPDPRDVDAAHPQALDTQHQQPVPMPEDPTPVEYERPLPQPGSKDYVAGQPVTDEEADAVEAEVQAKIEARDERLEQAKQAAARAQETPPPRRSDADKRSR